MQITGTAYSRQRGQVQRPRGRRMFQRQSSGTCRNGERALGGDAAMRRDRNREVGRERVSPKFEILTGFWWVDRH